MIKYTYITAICLLFLLGSCGRRNAANTTDQHIHEQHDHDHDDDHAGCDHDHESHDDHDHDHESHDHDHEAEGHSHDHEGDTHQEEEKPAAGEIVFTAEQASKIDFALYGVKRAPISDVIKASGIISSAPGDQSAIVAPVSGIVAVSGSYGVPGARVGSGYAVFHVSTRSMGEGDYAARVSAAYEQAKADYTRAQELAQNSIVSQKDLAAAKRSYTDAQTAYDAIAGKNSARGIAATAPLSGYLSEVNVQSGDYVEAGQLLARVSANRRMMLQADVPARYYGKLPKVAGANFKTVSGDKIYSTAGMNGRVASYGRSTEASSYYIPVVFEFDNPGDILSGVYADVYLLSSEKKEALVIPVGALVEEQGFYYVYVSMGNDHYEKREVTLGSGNGSETEVVSGLSEGDTIVSKGAYNIRLASASGAIPHGHTH